MATDQADPALPAPSPALLAELEAIYRDVHANPELSMQEQRTSKRAADWLRQHGYDVTEGVGGTGVVGLLRNGDGPTVLLRADMDALPIRESTDCPTPAIALAPTVSDNRPTSPMPVATTCISSG